MRQLSLPFEPGLTEITKQPLDQEGLLAIQRSIRVGMEIYIPDDVEDTSMPTSLRMRHGGVIRVSAAEADNGLVEVEILQRTPIDVTDDNLHRLLEQPFNGCIVDGKEVVMLRKSTAVATRDVIALMISISHQAKAEGEKSPETKPVVGQPAQEKSCVDAPRTGIKKRKAKHPQK